MVKVNVSIFCKEMWSREWGKQALEKLDMFIEERVNNEEDIFFVFPKDTVMFAPGWCDAFFYEACRKYGRYRIVIDEGVSDAIKEVFYFVARSHHSENPKKYFRFDAYT